jgi:hypothetical protein
LEELFSRIALELEDAPARTADTGEAQALAAPTSTFAELQLAPSQPDSSTRDAPAPGPALKPAAGGAPKRQVYNLNPFELGAQRDLGAPKDPDAK